MAKKISQLTQATQVKSDDVTVIVQDGETKKLPLNMMVTKQDIENKKVAGLAKLDEIEATYENDTYTPTITVKNKSSVKVGEGDGVDYSANVMDGHAKSAILKGNTGYRDIDTGEFLETFEEGRNLELVSVKMPVLKTTGKNLFDGEFDLKISSSHAWSKNFIKVLPNTAYIFSHQGTDSGKKVDRTEYYNEKFELIGYQGINNEVTTPNDCHYIKFRYHLMDQDLSKVENTQLEQGTVATAYEPYKTNILTVNEDVTLRGNVYVNGELKEDTLDLVSGEHSISVDETVLNGSENWSVWYHTDTLLRFMLDYSNMSNLTNIKLQCDKIPSYGYNPDVEGLYGNSGKLFLIIDNSNNKLSGNTANDLKTYLSQNPITIHYPLKEKSIKTVDLMPSGTHPSTTPYCWKNGHIQLSSSGLLPNLEYSVVTSRAGQISQNAAMIVKNDKRIFDLEILLAGGLVNTTYQALILQNQVETGLSKVSLSSEKEPDYLLYHMIMKLIEEKAYKLDDLTEKVSVFYLYEKLSDEQFETIYSELYPFVEDEIVEEPVVEELPEVVEDEVIM